MTPDEYRAAIAALGWSQVEAGARLGVDPRTSRRWALGERDVPFGTALALRLLVHVDEYGTLTRADADRIARAL